jgi:hypothetical protein
LFEGITFGDNFKLNNKKIMKKIILISALVLFVASYSFASSDVVVEKAPTAQTDDDEKKDASDTEKKDSSSEKKEESCAKKESSCCKK